MWLGPRVIGSEATAPRKGCSPYPREGPRPGACGFAGLRGYGALGRGGGRSEQRFRLVEGVGVSGGGAGRGIWQRLWLAGPCGILGSAQGWGVTWGCPGSTCCLEQQGDRPGGRKWL